jgi:hypothetical protein
MDLFSSVHPFEGAGQSSQVNCLIHCVCEWCSVVNWKYYGTDLKGYRNLHFYIIHPLKKKEQQHQHHHHYRQHHNHWHSNNGFFFLSIYSDKHLTPCHWKNQIIVFIFYMANIIIYRQSNILCIFSIMMLLFCMLYICDTLRFSSLLCRRTKLWSMMHLMVFVIATGNFVLTYCEGFWESWCEGCRII